MILTIAKIFGSLIRRPWTNSFKGLRLWASAWLSVSWEEDKITPSQKVNGTQDLQQTQIPWIEISYLHIHLGKHQFYLHYLEGRDILTEA